MEEPIPTPQGGAEPPVPTPEPTPAPDGGGEPKFEPTPAPEKGFTPSDFDRRNDNEQSV